MIIIEELKKKYNRRSKLAVDGISFSVNNGEILGLVGLNGAGKTTTINASCGVVLPSGGRILIDDVDIVAEKSKASREIGWVSEFPNFEPNTKALHLMLYFSGFYKIPRKEAFIRSMDLLRTVGLEEDAYRQASAYSQGMKKRLALASALISNPRNLLLDEILNGLDPSGINLIKKLMLEWKKQGKAILLSTHLLGILENLADRVVIMHHGKIIKTLANEEMKSLGSTGIRIRVDHVDKSLEVILSKYGNVRIDGQNVTITDISDEQDMENISSDISANGYRISHLDLEKTSLEDYFLNLIGEVP